MVTTSAASNEHFSMRLKQAMEMHPQAPEAEHGRLTWLRKYLADEHDMQVTLSTVHKWASAQSVPRRQKLMILAEALNVDETWLLTGKTPSTTPDKQRQEARRASGAVMYLAGLVELQGGHVAFPTADDMHETQHNVHLFMTFEGSLRRITVIKGIEEDNHVIFNIPAPTLPGAWFIGVAADPAAGSGSFALYDLSETRSESLGGYSAISAQRDKRGLATEAGQLPKITGFGSFS
ncbi:MAG: hypothetical protein AAF986_01035 [Pseudomonadota bacterium]